MASRLSRSVRDINAQTLPRVFQNHRVRPSGGDRVAPVSVSLALSAAILAALYRSIDVRLIIRDLRSVDRVWLVMSVGMIVPITLLRAIRFYLVAPRGTMPGVGEALRLTLVSSAANVFLPAKSGDLIKSYFLANGRWPSRASR
jgi:uncharacterized membrane protein YbhN (UPF0104 family)